MKRREYIIVPVEIWEDENLSKTEMLLYSEIDSFSRYGECFASNEHFSKYLRVSKDRVSKLLTSLRRKGYIDIELIYKKGTKEIEKRIIRPTSIHNLRHRQDGQEGIGEMDIPSRTNGQDPLGESAVLSIGESAYDNNTLNTNNTINITSNNKKTNKKKISSADLEKEFEQLWKIYPRKIGKEVAKKSFKKARKDKDIPYETIENGLYRYINYLETQGTEEQYIMHGSTWMNQAKWEDEYICVATQKKPKNAMEYLKVKYGGDNYESRGNRKIVDDYPKVLPESF
jgi:hypothetical protein